MRTASFFFERKRINFINKLKNKKKFFDKELNKLLLKVIAPHVLKKVMLYSVLNGGKRIRPFIISEVSSLFNVKPKVYKYPALAIELAHCFSLIYDDLPCMDDDILRRGKPTVHIKFNEANALLGGASLLTHAYNVLANKKFIVDEKKKILLIESFSEAIGHAGMLAGQFLDLEAENPKYKLSLKKYDEIQKKKTGLLIVYCCNAGGILGNASKKEQKILSEFGQIMGRIFQITDDILDRVGNEKLVGKKVNKDANLNKATIIRVKGIDFARSELKKSAIQAKKKLDELNRNTETLNNLIDYLITRTS
ncbi:MAG: farnesyl diphosphate synthase [Pseudomonadota bacterium]|nr:farnesyl diphosphate synthase [Pseudomonadota bacterium]